MSTLANHAFVKMNGLGNEIVVVDMRRERGAVSAEEARAAAQGVPYDQLMILHAPRAFPQYHPAYYATFFLDTEGFRLEVRIRARRTARVAR